jgi:hypothetical protein
VGAQNKSVAIKGGDFLGSAPRSLDGMKGAKVEAMNRASAFTDQIEISFLAGEIPLPEGSAQNQTR